MVEDMDQGGPKRRRSWRDRYAVGCLIVLTAAWIFILGVAMALPVDGLTFNVIFWAGFFAFVIFMIWSYQGLTE
jgi:hypothetical protein